MNGSSIKQDQLAKIISYLFLPPVVNLISFIAIIYSFESNHDHRLTSLLYTSLFTVVFPVLVFILFLKKGNIADADARNRNERHMPYLVFAAIILTGYLLIPWDQFADETRILFIIYLLNLLFLFFVNLFWKISAHTMGAGGLTGTFIFIFGWWGLMLLPVILVLAWARFQLKCHTPWQLFFGAFFGILNTLLFFKFLPLL
ncbi:MAG: hypothetical protein IPJ75_06840 [Ignavibacteriales bacterium]|nr:hypothetical protein [Ignavibacteriales bacterium]